MLGKSTEKREENQKKDERGKKGAVSTSRFAILEEVNEKVVGDKVDNEKGKE